MRIKLTADKSYPIAFDDTFDGVAYLDRLTVTDDEEWEEFIKELNEARKKIVNK